MCCISTGRILAAFKGRGVSNRAMPVSICAILDVFDTANSKRPDRQTNFHLPVSFRIEAAVVEVSLKTRSIRRLKSAARQPVSHQACPREIEVICGDLTPMNGVTGLRNQLKVEASFQSHVAGNDEARIEPALVVIGHVRVIPWDSEIAFQEIKPARFGPSDKLIKRRLNSRIAVRTEVTPIGNSITRHAADLDRQLGRSRADRTRRQRHLLRLAFANG